MNIKQPVDAFGSPIFPGLKIAYSTERGVRHGTIKSIHIDGSIRVAKERKHRWSAPVVRVTRLDRVFVNQSASVI